MAVGQQTILVAGGAAAGQLVALAATPWLTRAYEPGEFGPYAAFASLCAVCLTVSCLRYDVAVNAATDEELRAVVFAALLACLVATATIAPLAASPWGVVAIHRTVGDVAGAFRIAAAVALCGLYQLATATLVRDGRFAGSALLRALQPVAFVAAALAMPWGLIDSHLVGFAVALPVLAWMLTRHRPPTLSEIGLALSRHRSFVFVSLPSALLDALSIALPIWFIAANYSAQDTGHYAMAQRLLAAPALILAMAAGQVFVKRAGDLVRSGRPAQPLLRSTFGRLSTLVLALLAAIWAFGDQVLGLVLGDGWRIDTAFLLLAFLPAAIRSAVSPVTGIFVVRARLHVAAMWQFAYFAGTATLFAVLAGRVSLDTLLLAFCISEAFYYAWYLHLADKVAN